jgi:hypothetical protein
MSRVRVKRPKSAGKVRTEAARLATIYALHLETQMDDEGAKIMRKLADQILAIPLSVTKVIIVKDF